MRAAKVYMNKIPAGVLTENNDSSCNPDHTHILIGLHPSISVSEIVNKIKANSSGFYHKNLESNRFFAWQDGYGVFTNSRSQIDKVYNYIKNQKEHHKKQTFREEYLNMLKKIFTVRLRTRLQGC